MKMGQNSLVFKERSFILDKDKLYYYKKDSQKDLNFSMIPLVNSKLRRVDINAFQDLYASKK